MHDDIEGARRDVLAELDELPDGAALTADQAERIATVLLADLGRPRTPFEQALAEALRRVVDLRGEALPPGLDWCPRDDASDLLDILSRGRVIGSVSRTAVLARARALDAARRPH